MIVSSVDLPEGSGKNVIGFLAFPPGDAKECCYRLFR